MATIKLAEALLRRKELQGKVDQLAEVKESDMAEFKMQRVKATDGVDDIRASVPKVTMNQVTAAYDWHARQLRLVDAAIQQANWTTEMEIQDSVMAEYVENKALTKEPVKIF